MGTQGAHTTLIPKTTRARYSSAIRVQRIAAASRASARISFISSSLISGAAGPSVAKSQILLEERLSSGRAASDDAGVLAVRQRVLKQHRRFLPHI